MVKKREVERNPNEREEKQKKDRKNIKKTVTELRGAGRGVGQDVSESQT